MKIVHLATSLAGGAGIGLWRYHRALIGAGADSRVLTMHPPAGLEHEVAQVRWRKHLLPIRLLRRWGVSLGRPERIKNQLAALDRAAGHPSYELFTAPFSDYCPEDHPWIAEADIIQIHWVAGLLDWPRFFARVRQPVVFTLHDQQPYLGGFHYAMDAVGNSHLDALEKRLVSVKRHSLRRHRIGVVANSRWNAHEARASAFYPASAPIETVYYPLDTEVFTPRPRAPAKAAAGIDPTRLIIGFACENLNNTRKGFDDLLEAIADLPDPLRATLTLLSFGRDPAPALRARVTLPWVHLGFLHSDETKVAAYAAMDAFVVPSRAEAFGLTALEAGALGVPVVATRVGGLAEAVPDAVPGGTATLRDDLARLLADDALRATRGAAGRRLAQERHAPAAIGAQLLAFHRTLAG